MIRSAVVVFVLALALLFSWSVQAAGDVDKGEKLAKGCTCHKGDLDGMAADAFVSKMQGFKDGSLENRIMSRIAQKYNDTQIQDLAAWYAAK